MNPWKDIAGVPKDGTKVDLWHKEFGRLTNMVWKKQDYPQRRDSYPYFIGASGYGLAYYFGDINSQTRGEDITHYADIVEPD